jgi:hypothetical protein
MRAPRRPTRPRPPDDPQQLAHRIAEAVTAAWHRTPAAGCDLHVPVGVVAALSLLAPTDPRSNGITDLVRRTTPKDFARFLQSLWAGYVNLRPDLTPRAYPLFGWLFTPDPPPEHLLAAAQDTAVAALRTGLLHLTATARHDIDLLGVVLTVLRPPAVRNSRGQYYTPTDIAALLTSLLGVDGGQISDIAAGTGGMLRAAADTLRRAGRDPATASWVAVDSDELAIACLAVNAHLWDLGPDVLLGVGDVLTDDWVTRAQAQRDECLRLASTLRRDRHLLRWLTTLGAAAEPVRSGHAALEPAHPADQHETTGPAQ